MTDDTIHRIERTKQAPAQAVFDASEARAAIHMTVSALAEHVRRRRDADRPRRRSSLARHGARAARRAMRESRVAYGGWLMMRTLGSRPA